MSSPKRPWLVLANAHIRVSELTGLLDFFGDVATAVDQLLARLRETGLAEETCAAIASPDNAAVDAAAEWLEQPKHHIVTWGDRNYPAMLREIPKHKGTDKLQAELKQKISKTKKEIDAHRRGGAAAGHPGGDHRRAPPQPRRRRGGGRRMTWLAAVLSASRSWVEGVCLNSGDEDMNSGVQKTNQFRSTCGARATTRCRDHNALKS